MIKGSCLCGGVKYEAEGPVTVIARCHCVQCRKASGAEFATNGNVEEKGFRIVAGKELLASYESSPGKARVFCGRCGSPLFKRDDTRPGVLANRGEQRACRAAVELGRRLVADQKRGVACERKRESSSCLLAARQLDRPCVDPVAEAELAEHPHGAAVVLLTHRQVRNEILSSLLADERRDLAPVLSQRGRPRSSEIVVLDEEDTR